MTTIKKTPKQNAGLWYEQDPADLAEFAKFRIHTMEHHLQNLKNQLKNLDGDGWVRKPNEIKAPTQRDALNSEIVDSERRLFKARDFADAFTRISLRGGVSSEINQEIRLMKDEGILRRHPIDLQAEKILADECNIPATDDWFREYDPKFTV